MTIDILPCPFCGHDDPEIGEPEPNHIAIDCPECQCIGPYAFTIEAAVAMWNAPTKALRETQVRASIVTEQLQSLDKRFEAARA